MVCALTLLHSERPKLYAILAFLSAIGLSQAVTIIIYVRKIIFNSVSVFVRLTANKLNIMSTDQAAAILSHRFSFSFSGSMTENLLQSCR